jgi:hypothetical protein
LLYRIINSIYVICRQSPSPNECMLHRFPYCLNRTKLPILHIVATAFVIKAQPKPLLIVVVKKTFRLRNAFLLQHLCRHPFFRNIIMTSGINLFYRRNIKFEITRTRFKNSRSRPWARHKSIQKRSIKSWLEATPTSINHHRPNMFQFCNNW